MTDYHLVEVIDRTGGVALVCHSCGWNATIEVEHYHRQLTAPEYRRIRTEAAALKNAHEQTPL